MSNPFDQFDAAQTSAPKNPFDQFDNTEPSDRIAQADAYNAQLNERMGIQEQPPSASAEQSDRGFFNNAARGAGERAADLTGGLANTLAAAIESAPQGGFAPGYVGQFVSREQDEKNKKLAADTLAGAGEKLRAADLGYDEKRNTIDGAKAKFEKGDYLGSAFELWSAGNESMITSTPDMAGAIGALPVYVAARTGEIANERAKNKGLDRPTQVEINEAAPFAAASSFLERILPGRILRGTGEISEEAAKEISDNAVRYVMQKTISEAGQSALIEGGTEFVQEGVIEYIGQRYGTGAAMDVKEAMAQGAEAALLGSIGGSTLGAVKGAYDGVSDVRRAPATDFDGVDQPMNGEQLRSYDQAGGIVDNIPQESSGVQQPNSDPIDINETMVAGAEPANGAFGGVADYAEQQRQQELQQSRAWLDDETNLADAATAYGVQQGYISRTPDQIESELSGDADIDGELQALMAELEQAESLAREVLPANPAPEMQKAMSAPVQRGVNPFDQFDDAPPADGLFDGVREMQSAAANAAREQEAKRRELMNANFQEDEEGGLFSGVRALAEQSRFEPIKNEINPADISEIYPADNSQPEQLPVPANSTTTMQDQIVATPVEEPLSAPASVKEIDATANEAATSPFNDLPEPTDAMKEAGNYKKAHVKIKGLDIAIENPRGSTRSGTDPDGNKWETKMHSHYGYIKRTEGADGDQVDVFIGPNPESDKVFIVDQINPDGSFDEHKILIGFDSKLKARSGYKSNYSNGWKVGPITSMSMDEFKDWVKNGDTKKPLALNQSEQPLDMVPTSVSVPKTDQEPVTKTKNEEPQPSAGVSVSEGRVWERRSPKSWKSDDGQIIADHSMTVGGKKQKMVMVFSDQKAFDAGNNYATAETLAEAKNLVASSEKAKTITTNSQSVSTDPELPPILTQTKKQFIAGMAKERGLKKGSPGYADAMKKVEENYEQALDRAQAALPFDEFNRLNSDSPEGVNRQAWEALREEYGTEGIRYSLGSSGGITTESAQSAIDRIRRAWKNPHIKIEAVTDIDAMPATVRTRIQADKIPNEKVRAVYHNGSVYVNASAMRDTMDVERAVFHEVHGHYGARALFGRDTSAAMGRLYLAIGGERGIRDIAKKHGIDLSKYEQILKGESPGKRAEIMADELLAHIAQDNKPSVKRWLQELIGAIRTWLRAHGFAGLGKFSDSEVMALLKRTREAATELKLEGGSVLRVLLDVADASATTDTTQAAYSLSGLPPKTRKVIGSDPVLAAWTMLAKDDFAFQLPVSDKKTLEGVFDETVPDVKIERTPDFDDNGAEVWKLEPDDSTLALVFLRGDEVWIDVADFKQGQGGRRIYNAASNFAFNTGKTFIGDPAGLSDKAMARRLENMISSALKFGTTKHIRPHEKQIKGGSGVPAIDWKEGNDSHNLREMINASYEATKNQFPEIEKLRYDPENDQFIQQDSGNVFTKRDFDKLADSKRSGSYSGSPHSGAGPSTGSKVTAGGRTIERAVLTHSILRGTREEQSLILDRLGGQRSQRLAGTLYSLSSGSQQQTRPSGGFSFGRSKTPRGATLPHQLKDAYNQLGGANKTLYEKVKTEVRRQLAPRGLLPREIFDLKIARDGAMNADDSQQRFILTDFYEQIQTVYKKPYHELRRSTRKEINDYLKGDRTNVQLTGSMVTVLDRMRAQIQSLSRSYMDELLLDAANLEADGKLEAAAAKRALIETITENFDSYLHRSYRAFDDPDWPKKVPEDVYQNAVNFLARQYSGSAKPDAAAIEKATKKVDLILHEGTAYDSMGRFISESKLGSKDLSVIKKRKQISPEIRALLGEYEDPAINYAKSVTKMTRLVHNTAFLRQMTDISLQLGYIFEEENRPVGANKKIAADASEVYAPLNGMYTYPEFEQALRDAVGASKEPDWYKVMVAANGAVKYGKTVLAPTTAVRNFLSAAMFSLTSGHWNASHLEKSVKVVKTYFTGKDVRGSREYINKLLKLGVLYDAPNYRELQDLIKSVNESDHWLATATRKSKLGTALNYAQEFYALGDDFWKILGFENEKATLIKHYNMSEAAAEKEAAERIRNTYPTYSLTGKGIQTLRRFPVIGSFPSFPAEIIRTTFHKFRYFHKDAKALGYANPSVLAKGVGLALGAGMMAGLSALSAAIFGVDDDEEEAIRQMLPEWSKNSSLFFLGRDDKGQVQYMDLGWLDPYGYWKKPISALARDADAADKLGDAAWEALSPFIGLDIAVGATGQFIYDSFFNDSITTEKANEKLIKGLAPGFYNNALGFWEAAHETVTKSGKKYTFGDEALALIGFRKGTLNAKVGLTYQAYGYADRKRQAATVLRDKATDLGKVDIDELRDAYEKSMGMQKNAWDDMRRTVKMAMKTGMTKPEAIAALRTSGMSLRDASGIVSDREFNYRPSKTMMKLAIKRAGILFDKETQAELRERQKRLNELQREYLEKPVR